MKLNFLRRKVFSHFSNFHRKLLPVLFLILIFNVIFEMLSISLIVPVISYVIDYNNEYKFSFLENIFSYFGFFPGGNHAVFLYTAVIVILFLKTIFFTFSKWFQIKYFYSLTVYFTDKMVTKYLTLPYLFHLNSNSANLVNSATNEVDHFVQYSKAVIDFILEVLLIFGLIIILMINEPLGTIVAASFIGSIAFIFIISIKRSVREWGETRQSQSQARIKTLQESFGIIKEIKVLNVERFFSSKHKKQAAELGNASVKQNFISEIPRFYLEFIAGSAFLLVCIIFSIGEISVVKLFPIIGLFAVCVIRIIPSVNRIISFMNTFKFCLPAVNLIDENLKRKEDSHEDILNMNEISFNKSIKLENVAFKYGSNGREILKDVNIEIKRNNFIGVIGKSGSGKTTFIDLILGLLKPSRGQILADDKDISLNISSWQRKIGYVPQDVYLIDDSIRNNIALGKSDVDDLKINNVIESAQLVDFIKTLPHGLDTKIGERGAKISGGELQRVGIARALYHNPEIIILDEPTSALDSVTESKFIEFLEQLRSKVTVICVSHRISVLVNCDFLYSINSSLVKKAD